MNVRKEYSLRVNVLSQRLKDITSTHLIQDNSTQASPSSLKSKYTGCGRVHIRVVEIVGVQTHDWVSGKAAFCLTKTGRNPNSHISLPKSDDLIYCPRQLLESKIPLVRSTNSNIDAHNVKHSFLLHNIHPHNLHRASYVNSSVRCITAFRRHNFHHFLLIPCHLFGEHYYNPTESTS